MSSQPLTVGALRKILRAYPADTKVTFGASKYRMRPLIFYRTKERDEKLLQVELNELDSNCEPASEHECRITVQELLDHMKLWGDDVEITFGSSMDAVALEFTAARTVLAIDLAQPGTPHYKVRE